jgi:hypothetical protein
MLIIRKGETNNLIATVSMNKTLPNPYYLFSFQHIASKERVSFIPQVIVSNTRYDKFRFVEGPTNLSLTPPHAFFNYIGQYYYSIYEQVSSGNTDIALAYNKLESGRAIVIVGDSQTDECLFEPYISPNEDAYSIIYVSEQEEFCITGGTPTPTVTITSSPTPTPSITPTNTPTNTLTPTPTTTPSQVFYYYNIQLCTGGAGTINKIRSSYPLSIGSSVNFAPSEPRCYEVMSVSNSSMPWVGNYNTFPNCASC